MDQVALVDRRIDDGRKLILQLVRDGFPVAAAFWLKGAEDPWPHLFVASVLVEQLGPAEAYRRLQASLQQLPGPGITLIDVKLIGAANHLTAAVRKLQKTATEEPIHLRGDQLSNVAVEEAYIYPAFPRRETTEFLDDVFLEILRKVIQGCHPRIRDDRVAHALLLLLVRVANTWNSIRTLRKHTPHQNAFMVDAGALIRAMFDAYLQADYIFKDPAVREHRATLYLDFERVERYQLERKVTSHDDPFANSLKSSPKRPEGTRRLRAEYDRVKDAFLVEKRQQDGTVKRGPGTRNKWYEGDLAQLAEAVGRRAEYDYFVTTFHGCIHSSALALSAGPLVSPEHILTLASIIAARVAKLNVSHNRLDIGDDEQILDELSKGFREPS